MQQDTRELVLITGGNGLIGTAVAKRLSPNYRVVSLDLKKPGQAASYSESISMDMSSEESIRQALWRVRRSFGSRVASVVHLAAYYSFSGEDSPKYEEITVRGTRRLLQALQEFEVRQFIFSSTMLVHAPCEPGQQINESWPVDAKWPYPASKVRAEEAIRATRENIPCVILRIAGVYDDRCRSIPLAHQIERILEHHVTGHFYPGGLKKGQAFVHLDDLTEAVSRVIERRSALPPETTLLLGEPETLSYGNLQEELGTLIHGKAWPTQRVPKLMAKAGAWVQDQLPVGEDPFIKPWMIDRADDHYALDISRARELLGWEPKHRLRESLPRLIEALRSDPEAWFNEHKLSRPIPWAVNLRSGLPWVLAGLIAFSSLVALTWIVLGRKKVLKVVEFFRQAA